MKGKVAKEEREQEEGNGNVSFIIYVDAKDYYFVVNIMIILPLLLTNLIYV